MDRIPFNKPYVAGKELFYIAQAVTYGNIGGDGHFTAACSQFLERTFGIHKVLMTPSCTAALEMAVILIGLQPGDEVIMPSFTFVSTANAVVRAGGRPVFVDIRLDTCNIDERQIEAAITPRTRAIMPVHYAGVGSDMQSILDLAEQHDLVVIEDAAQGVNAFYNDQPLGAIGHMGCYSFHETKNYVCGEGGALCLNSPEYVQRAEIIRDKGTNRRQFLGGSADKYTWVDIGSSYVPSEIACAFLYGQFEMLDVLAQRRREIFEMYRSLLEPLEQAGLVTLSRVPDVCRSNHHLFYILLRDQAQRDALIADLARQQINAVFHYVPLHSSPMGRRLGRSPKSLPVTESVSGRLLRLPFYYEINAADQTRIIDAIALSLDKSSAHFHFPVRSTPNRRVA